MAVTPVGHSHKSQIGRKIQLFTALRELERRRWDALEEDDQDVVRDLTAEIETLQQSLDQAGLGQHGAASQRPPSFRPAVRHQPSLVIQTGAQRQRASTCELQDDRSSEEESEIAPSPLRHAPLPAPRSPASPALQWGERPSPASTVHWGPAAGQVPRKATPDQTSPAVQTPLPTFGGQREGGEERAGPESGSPEHKQLSFGLPDSSPSLLECEADVSSQAEAKDGRFFTSGSSASTLSPETPGARLGVRSARSSPRAGRPTGRRGASGGRVQPSKGPATTRQPPRVEALSGSQWGTPPPQQRSPSAVETTPESEVPEWSEEEALYPVIGEYVTRCIYSDSCSLREAALQKLAQDLYCGAKGGEELDKVVGSVATVLQKSFQDGNSQVFLASADLLQAACVRLAARTPTPPGTDF